jgi:hypothetical protein
MELVYLQLAYLHFITYKLKKQPEIRPIKRNLVGPDQCQIHSIFFNSCHKKSCYSLGRHVKRHNVLYFIDEFNHLYEVKFPLKRRDEFHPIFEYSLQFQDAIANIFC